MKKERALQLVWYCKTPRGWRRFPAIMESPIRAKRGFVIDGGEEVEYPEGRFEIVQYINRKRVYTRIENVEAAMKLTSTDPRDAALALDRAKRHQRRVPVEDKAVIKTAVKAYIADCKARKALEAAEQARHVLDEFVPICNVTYVRGITREHILKFHSALRKRGMSDRTVSNKHGRLKSFLLFCGVDVKKVMPPAPKYEQGLPVIYSKAEIEAIREAADGTMRMVIDMAYKLGLREQELTFAEWTDIDWEHSAFRVQGKPRLGFVVKDQAMRDIPIPSDLLASLKAWQETRKGTTLILGTTKKTPNTHLLRTLKRLAKRAGLNCGRCEGCAGNLGECEEWYLHRFRATYLTTLLRNGVDARTVQSYAGHSDLATTLKYLKPASTTEMQDKINAIAW
jgi:integrase